MEDWTIKILRRFSWIVKSTTDVRLSRGVLHQVGPAFRTRRINRSTIETVCRCKCGAYRIVLTHRMRTPGEFEKCTCAPSVPWIVNHRRRERVQNSQLRQIAPAFRSKRYCASTVEAVFQCRCGRHEVFPIHRVAAGDIRSCGCRLKRKPEHSLLVDALPVNTATLIQVGHAFRALLGGQKRTMAVFACKCGNHCILDVHRAASGAIQSCGCRVHTPDHLKQLIADQRILRLRKCLGEVVDEQFCHDDEGSLVALYADIGAVPAHSMLAMDRPGRGWVAGNLRWVSVAQYLRQQQSALMRHVLQQTQLMSRRKGMVQRDWKTGTDAAVMAAIVRDCGHCPSVYHVLAKVDPSADWVRTNGAWLAPDEQASELIILLRKRIARASKPKAGNTRTHRQRVRQWLEYRGETLSVRELAERVGLTLTAMTKRLARYPDVESAVAGRKAKRNEVAR